MPVNISPRRLEDEMMRSLELDKVSVQPVEQEVMEGISSNYRMYDIQFTSRAGNVPALECDITGLSSVDSSFDAHGGFFDAIICDVTDDFINATSTNPHGTFGLTYNGTYSQSLSTNATILDVEAAVEDITNKDVTVSRNIIDAGAGFEWLITFAIKESEGIELLGTDSALIASSISSSTSAKTLHGTSAAVVITEVQRGSDLHGGYLLAFGGSVSKYVSYDLTAHEMKSIIQSFPEINRVEVTRDNGMNYIGSRYLITFVDPPGDVQQIRVYTDELSGSAVSARAYEHTKGVGSVKATFKLGHVSESAQSTQFEMNRKDLFTTDYITADTSAEEMEVLLEALDSSAML